MGGRLDIDSNGIAECINSSHIVLKLKSLRSSSIDGPCGLTIKYNTGYRFIRWFGKMGTFNDFLSIIVNEGLYDVAGFVKITSLNFTVIAAE